MGASRGSINRRLGAKQTNVKLRKVEALAWVADRHGDSYVAAAGFLILIAWYVGGIILSFILLSTPAPNWFLSGGVYTASFVAFERVWSKLFERGWGEWYRALRTRNQPTPDGEKKQS
jgi:hypothetical protein